MEHIKQNETRNETWQMAEVWNAALVDRKEKPLTERSRLWASELGRPAIDTYLKLKGTPYTNPPNERALRKFEAGNVYEWIVSLVLKRSGILKQSQAWCEYQYPGLLPVSGKCDFIAGGIVNREDAEKFIQFLADAEIPNVFLRCFARIIPYLSEKYPNGLDTMPLEIKSVSSFAMDKLEVQQRPMREHRKQLFHYLKAMDYEKANIVYICRDDLRMMEFPVLNPSPVEDEYRSSIEVISRYYHAEELPPKEPLIVFDDEYGKFSKNLGIEWSPYLELLYGFKEPKEYGEKYQRAASNWNRVIKRVKEGKNQTDKNKIVLEEIQDAGFSVEEVLQKFKTEGIEEVTE